MDNSLLEELSNSINYTKLSNTIETNFEGLDAHVLFDEIAREMEEQMLIFILEKISEIERFEDKAVEEIESLNY